MRINAEDPSRGFAPAPGADRRASGRRSGPGVRVDTFVEDGTDDHAVLRLADREADRRRRQTAASRSPRALRALGELEIAGVPTTRDVLREILDSDEFRSGDYSTSFLEEAGARLPALAGS